MRVNNSRVVPLIFFFKWSQQYATIKVWKTTTTFVGFFGVGFQIRAHSGRVRFRVIKTLFLSLFNTLPFCVRLFTFAQPSSCPHLLARTTLGPLSAFRRITLNDPERKKNHRLAGWTGRGTHESCPVHRMTDRNTLTSSDTT